MSVPSAKKKQYRSIGHKLNPIVTVAGKGLSENVVAEINRALEDHELIKVKVAVSERETRTALVRQILTDCQAELIQEIGKIALILRESQKPDPQKSNIR